MPPIGSWAIRPRPSRLFVDLSVGDHTVAGMTSLHPAARLETFGFGSRASGATIATLHLLYGSPRVFDPLVRAWDSRVPGVSRELTRLSRLGLVAHQPAVMVDVRTGQVTTQRPRSVPRWVATAAGRRLHAQVEEDSRVLGDTFPEVSDNEEAIAILLQCLDVPTRHRRVGVSVSHLALQSGLSDRHVRWWMSHLSSRGFARRLPVAYPDVREMVPPHWRATAALTRQLKIASEAFPRTAPVADLNQMQVNRRDFLTDLTPTRVDLSGASDFDHDVSVQRLMAHLVSHDPTVVLSSVRTEPRFGIRTDTSTYPWLATDNGDDVTIYQPDALFTYTPRGGSAWRSVVEYERLQTRKNGWIHLERFVALRNLDYATVEQVELRFVVDTTRREAGYVALCEAFATWLSDHPDHLPARPTTVMVSSLQRLYAAADPLAAHHWSHLELPIGRGWEMMLHATDTSPYREFF